MTAAQPVRRGAPGKPVYMDGCTWFASGADAARALVREYRLMCVSPERVDGMSAHISRAANGGAHTAYGHTWTRRKKVDK